MPVLREAVEKQRVVFIKKLIHAGVFKQADLETITLTLTELARLYEKHVLKKV